MVIDVNNMKNTFINMCGNHRILSKIPKIGATQKYSFHSATKMVIKLLMKFLLHHLFLKVFIKTYQLNN